MIVFAHRGGSTENPENTLQAFSQVSNKFEQKAIIETDVILGAGSLVAPGKILESGYLYVGRPAKQIRPLTDMEYQALGYSADNYVQLKDQYLTESY